jgi:hypothetical protein
MSFALLKLDNLVTLCRRHHWFVHEYGFRIDRSGGELRFVRPDGRVVEAVRASARIDYGEVVGALEDRAAHA